jgi:hypothetical protein
MFRENPEEEIRVKTDKNKFFISKGKKKKIRIINIVFPSR